MIHERQRLLRSGGRTALVALALLVILSCTEILQPFYDEEEQDYRSTQGALELTHLANYFQTATALSAQVTQLRMTETALAAAPPIQPPQALAPQIEAPVPAPQQAPQVAASSPPIITRVDFPSSIPSNGTKFTGWVSFKDPDGDVNLIRIHVLRSVSSIPDYEHDPNHMLQGTPTDGQFGFQFWCGSKQEITSQVTLFDLAGNSSNTMEFTVECY